MRVCTWAVPSHQAQRLFAHHARLSRSSTFPLTGRLLLLFLLPLISFRSFPPLLFAYFPQLQWVAFSPPVSTMRPRPVSVSIMLIHPRACQLSSYSLSGNDAIENQLKRDRMMAKNEIKMLLLGAGESGKVCCDVDP